MRTLSLLFSLCCLAAPAFASDATPAQGAAKAHLCTGCHGVDGMKSAPGAAPIGGRPVGTLVSAMQDYRHLRRLNPAMQVLLLSMTDEDILVVAEYFSSAGGAAER